MKVETENRGIRQSEIHNLQSEISFSSMTFEEKGGKSLQEKVAVKP